MRTIATLSFVLCAAAAGCGPRPGEPAAGRIAGRVVEVPGDLPLEGVRIALVFARSEGAGAFTDREGAFVVGKGPSDSDPLAVRAEKAGYVRGYRPLGGAASGGAAPAGPMTIRLLRADPLALVAALKHPEIEVRCDAARALGELPWHEALAALREALGDESGLVRFAAKEALGRIERPAP